MKHRRGDAETRRNPGFCSFSPRLCVSASLVFVFVVSLHAQQVTCRNGKCERIITGTAPAATRLRVKAHGPVTLEAGSARDISYSVRVIATARTEAEARRLLQLYSVRIDAGGPWTVLSAPGGPVETAVSVKTPRLAAAAVSTSEGAVHATGIEGPLDVDTGAGEIAVDRVRGDCTLTTGGGHIRAGQMGGSLKCTTGAGNVNVDSARGEVVLATQGGEIFARDAGGAVRAETGGGGVHIGTAAGSVTAITGGGEIIVEKSGGVVNLRNLAGPVNVGSAAGVRCDSASGGIRLGNISGPIRVATSMGSIMAALLGSHLADSYLATGNGDITVLIPSNVGVTIQADNTMADTLRRIISDFSAVQPRRQGTHVVAAGTVNGGGPVLQLAATGGTIFIKKQ
jgi:DUF4097 and DUF4098 domain-containing protein YvlB